MIGKVLNSVIDFALPEEMDYVGDLAGAGAAMFVCDPFEAAALSMDAYQDLAKALHHGNAATGLKYASQVTESLKKPLLAAEGAAIGATAGAILGGKDGAIQGGIVGANSAEGGYAALVGAGAGAAVGAALDGKKGALKLGAAGAMVGAGAASPDCDGLAVYLAEVGCGTAAGATAGYKKGGKETVLNGAAFGAQAGAGGLAGLSAATAAVGASYAVGGDEGLERGINAGVAAGGCASGAIETAAGDSKDSAFIKAAGAVASAAASAAASKDEAGRTRSEYRKAQYEMKVAAKSKYMRSDRMEAARKSMKDAVRNLSRLYEGAGVAGNALGRSRGLITDAERMGAWVGETDEDGYCGDQVKREDHHG